MERNDPVDRARAIFRQRHGRAPDVIAVAPGRVNLIGDHVDYAGGLVLPIAIERRTAVAIGLGPSDDGLSRISAAEISEERALDLAKPRTPAPPDGPDAFLNYVAGPIDELRRGGLEVPRMDLVITSTIPMGGGLSSSAALEVAVLLGVRHLAGRPVDVLELAREAQRSEHRQAGTPCGIMDMYVSAAARSGHACLIDCRDDSLRRIPMPPSGDAVVLVLDTSTRHELSDGGYASRRADCEEARTRLDIEFLSEADPRLIESADLPERVRRRARHVVGETARVAGFSAALESGDLRTAGELMFESHRSLRDLFEVSCPELDLLVAVAEAHRDRGVLGSRMTGGGFGGCTVTLLEPEAVPGFLSDACGAFVARFGHEPASFVTGAANGAGLSD